MELRMLVWALATVGSDVSFVNEDKADVGGKKGLVLPLE